MTTATVVISIIFAIGLGISLIAMAVLANNPSITARQANGLMPTADDIQEAKARARRGPAICAIICAILLLCTLGYGLVSAGLKKASANDFVQSAMGQLNAAAAGQEAGDVNTVSSNETDEATDGKHDTTAENGNTTVTENTAVTAGAETVTKGAAAAESDWRTLAAYITDDPEWVYPNMDLATLTAKYEALRFYGDISHYHLTSGKMDRIKVMIAQLYGLGKVGDMLNLPVETFADWPWLYQVAGCVAPTSNDLKGIDLSADEAVKKLLETRKKEVWDPAWKEMTDQEKVEQTLLATEVAILNDPRTGEAWLKHYMGIDYVYEAGKTDLDYMARLYEKAFDMEGKDTEKDAYGILVFLDKITAEQFKAGELWKAGVNDLYFNNIGTHLCELLLSVYYENVGFKELQSASNICLPMSSSDVLRRPVEATYQEKHLALVREQYGKRGTTVLRDGINRYDLRPETFVLTVTRTPNPPTDKKPNQYALLIEYKYDNLSGNKVFEPHLSLHNENDPFRVVSPPKDGYSMSIAAVIPNGWPVGNAAVVEGKMPKGNLHVVIVYTKNPPPPPKDDGPGKGSDPGPGTEVTIPKDAGKEPVRNGQDGQTGGGPNSGNENGVEASRDAETQNRTQKPADTNQNQQQTTVNNGNTTSTTVVNNGQVTTTITDNKTGNTVDTQHQADTTSKPNDSQTAAAATTNVSTTTNNSDGSTTTVEKPADISKGTYTANTDAPQ